MADYETVIVKTIGLTLSRLLWRHRGRLRVTGLLETTLDLNPGLSGEMKLAVGTEIKIPYIEDDISSITDEPIQIFS
ncbi:P2-like prophage tail protein X [Cohaesibacter sp. ES.047]|uniref:tail protein X n=1 Tax=Cohaesibacter sp. ES.047 TaxID=1798205 RepID=UPI000BB98E32|nr:tail protein X [Cohaesibacter sp. ES.047]SNY93439.1 P2-like prophage tail protein X [Cohaesibacter sp. ES.047]